ncbi:hypothetical protein NEUTE1DRAFT_46919 [Neurospora tetrasperma FGSC 2508]|uniref:Uncharacterized protein n=1 Tax=Neurospora tetrasperma (strain FGSC 2508 / ATCC MYA-4615 / P0657) TaxID=510951 RepID=F8MTC5_NEUT8|nr:uncharacterized protein NEUTE1DRAFT_46919 [Neurospora tetrasperma FGSC 2508]EGO55257.1 hypothetical protein NEUTE1DRAFT_46919 [Neurospora tetrasperma FGSC 2508]EGZ69524.1 hypothetical protein NEUTE2DRAFT_72875 [Neurospora tetrasperma FGSC 2509]
MSLQGEQDTMVSILQAATTSTAAKLRTPSPDSQDIDLLALAANACRVRRYRAEEPTGSTAKMTCQKVCPVYTYEGHVAVAGQFVPKTAGFRDLGVSPSQPLWAKWQKPAAIWVCWPNDLLNSLGYTNL